MLSEEIIFGNSPLPLHQLFLGEKKEKLNLFKIHLGHASVSSTVSFKVLLCPVVCWFQPMFSPFK